MPRITPLCIRLSDSIKETSCSTQGKMYNDMFYDPVDGINKIRIGDLIVPAVTMGHYLGTETFTKAKAEDTDQDPQRGEAPLLGTQTYTEAQIEDTDSDPSQYMFLSTHTYTFVMSEDTDEDPQSY